MSALFFLVKIEPDPKDPENNKIEVPLPDYGPFSTGPDAAREAKFLSEKLGLKVQPRRMAQAEDWRVRQAKRLEDGTYLPLPKEWERLALIPDHFAHIRPQDPTKVGFTESPEKGIMDKTTIVGPRTYLSRFYPELNDEQKSRLARVIDKTSVDFHIATTPEEIRTVYETCSVSSCMKGKNWPEDEHPASMYGAGDLGIAYIKGKSGNIGERALVWADKSIHGRIYADSNRKLQLLLEEAGFKFGTPQQFSGAKLVRKVVMKNDRLHYVIPYIDGQNGGTCQIKDMGDHLILDENGTIPCGSASGYIPCPPGTKQENEAIIPTVQRGRYRKRNENASAAETDWFFDDSGDDTASVRLAS